MNDRYSRESAEADFAGARWLAGLQQVLNVLRRREDELLPYAEVVRHFLVRGRHDRGLQSVQLSRIVGSQGRYADFSRTFLPRSARTAARWKSVSRARENNVDLPPVELYKLGEIYFVADGNHRVSVARYAGQPEIAARVIEVAIDVPLTPDLRLADLIRKAEQSDFFEWTDLARLRPGCAIEVSELGGYLELIRHINWQRACLEVQRNAEVDSRDAVLDWYDTVYLPLVETIRHSAVLGSFAGRTETDLYLWLMEHGRELLEQHAAGNGRRTWMGTLRRLVAGLRPR